MKEGLTALRHYLIKDSDAHENISDTDEGYSHERDKPAGSPKNTSVCAAGRGEDDAAPNCLIERSTEQDEETHRLLRHLAEGNFAAFCEIWERCQPYLFRLCLRQMNGMRDKAEDALSRAMLTAWDRLPRHAHKIRDVKAWLGQLTFNLCTDIQREHRRQTMVFEYIDDVSLHPQELVSSVKNPEELLAQRELCSYLRYLISELPLKLHDPFMLRFMQEMSYVDISTQLDLSTENIRKRIQQARTILRDRLSNYVSGQMAPEENLRYKEFMRPGTRPHSFVNIEERGPVEEITYKAVTIRLTQVTLPSGIEQGFQLVLDRRLSKRQHTRIDTLTKYVRKHPGGWKKRLNLADLLYETGRWEEALEEYRLVLKTPRRLIDSYLRLGRILHLMERDEEAIEVYQSALLVVRNEASRRHLAGLIEVCRHCYDAATCEFWQAAILEPKNVNHILEIGLSRLSEESYVAALKAFDDSLKIVPNNIVALTYSYEALLQMGRLRKAHQHITLALGLDRENVPALKWLADYRSSWGLVRGKEGQRTRQLIEKALQLSSESAEAHESLALYHLFRGEWTESIAVMRAYTEHHLACPEGWHCYALLLSRTGESAGAVEAIMKAYALHRSDWRIQKNACKILASARRSESLLTILEEMLVRFPNHWSLWTTAGLTLMTAGNEPDRACAIATRGPQLQPYIPLVWFEYGRVLALADKHLEATAALNVGQSLLSEVSEQTIKASAWLGESMRNLGRHQEAQDCWSKVVRLVDEFTEMNPARASYWRGMALENLGDTNGSLLAYESALQSHLLYPERQELQQRMKRLRSEV